MLKLFNVCSKYATEHSLSWQVLFFNCVLKQPQFSLRGLALHFGEMRVLNVTNCTSRYLGVIISVNDHYLDLKRQKIFIFNNYDYANTNMFLRKFVKCTPHVKCYIFKRYYCNLHSAPYWYDSTETAMMKLNVQYCYAYLAIILLLRKYINNNNSLFQTLVHIHNKT